MRVRQIFLQYNLYVIMRVSLLTGGFQKEVDRIDLADPVMIKRRVVIKCDERFRILVANCLERGEFAFERRFISDGERNLKVSWGGVFKSDEVDFLPVNRTDMHIAVSAFKLEKNDVLKNVPHIAASLSCYNGAKPLIGYVVFAEGFEIVATFNIVSCSMIYKERFAKCVDVGVYRLSSNGDSFRLECSGDTVYGKWIADIVKDESDNAFKKCSIPETESGKCILVDDRIKYRRKVVNARGFVRAKRRYERKTSKSHILGERLGLGQLLKCGLILGERKGLHRDFHITPGQKRRKFAGKEFGVGSRYIHIRVAFDKKSVHKSFKFWNLLNFIKKNIDFVERIIHFGTDKLPGIIKCSEYSYIRVFKVNGNDLILVYALREQFFAKESQKCGFSAPAYSSNDFDDIFIPPIREPICKKRSIYYTCHIKTPKSEKLFVHIVSKVGKVVNESLEVRCMCNQGLSDVIRFHPRAYHTDGGGHRSSRSVV
mgnify:CR=1 FL=1